MQSLTLPRVEHVIYEEVDEAHLRLGNVARVAIKHRHNDRQIAGLLVIGLQRIATATSWTSPDGATISAQKNRRKTAFFRTDANASPFKIRL
jgi:hypothetical protein